MNHTEAEMIGAYALDALSEQEAAEFEAHLATCSACQEELLELSQVVDVLPLALEPVAPPERVRARIMEAVSPPPPLSLHRRRTRWLASSMAAVAAAAVIAALGLWNWNLHQQIDQQHQAMAFQHRVDEALAQGATVSRVPGVGVGASASAALVQPVHRSQAYLIVHGLPPVPANKVYELWLVPPSAAPRAAGTFTTSGSEPTVLPVTLRVQGYVAAAVTIEPGPAGGASPSGPKVLLGKLRA